MKIYKILSVNVVISLLLVFMSCNNIQQHIKIDNWEYYKSYGDSLLSVAPEKNRKIFIETKHQVYKNVTGLSEWQENYLSIVNLVIGKNLLIYTESPYSESGDWNNNYISYYNKKGNLEVFIRESSFFNGDCVDGIITEKTVYSYGSNKLTKRKYEIYDENMKPITDTSKCIFNYRFKYNVYKKYNDIPVVKQYKILGVSNNHR